MLLPSTVRLVGAPRLVGDVEGASLKRPPPWPLPPLPPTPPAPPSAWLPRTVQPGTVRTAPSRFAIPPPSPSPPLPPAPPWPPRASLSASVLLLIVAVLLMTKLGESVQTKLAMP